jgi:hypothetical protein
MPRKRASKKVAQEAPAVPPRQKTPPTPPPVRRSSRSQTPSKKVRFQQDEPLTERDFDIIDRGLALKEASERAKKKGLLVYAAKSWCVREQARIRESKPGSAAKEFGRLLHETIGAKGCRAFAHVPGQLHKPTSPTLLRRTPAGWKNSSRTKPRRGSADATPTATVTDSEGAANADSSTTSSSHTPNRNAPRSLTPAAFIALKRVKLVM